MQIAENVEFGFTEQVKSNSGVRNPLGMSSNLGIQGNFTTGITSVTPRARYYTLWAYYYEHLRDDEIITYRNLERLFILSCLVHHDGDYSHPSLYSIINKTRFSDEWDEYDSFALDFDIAGQGYTYYKSQLEKFRCAWSRADEEIRTPLNRKLAESLNTVSEEAFERNEYSKEFIDDRLTHLCPCQEHEEEQEVLPRLLFGFLSKNGGEWDLDDEEFSDFMNGRLELEFDEDFDEEESIDPVEITRQRNLRRRNTLFLFLKIVSENQPEDTDDAIWNGVYFIQRNDESEIDFGELERCRKYWEYFHLNCYYVYCLEKLLLSLHEMIERNPNIKTEKMREEFESDELVEYVSDFLEVEVQTVEEALSAIEERNDRKRTWIESPVNEKILYDKISSSDSWREASALSVLLILLLKHRYELTEDRIRKYESDSMEGGRYVNQLDIDAVLGELSGETDIAEFAGDLMIKIKNRHRIRATSRFDDTGTKAWLFTEQDGRLSPSNQDGFRPRTRDNRWGSIETLLTDLNFVHTEDEKTVLTQRGEKWLSQIE
jgi:hypothetical protein